MKPSFSLRRFAKTWELINYIWFYCFCSKTMWMMNSPAEYRLTLVASPLIVLKSESMKFSSYVEVFLHFQYNVGSTTTDFVCLKTFLCIRSSCFKVKPLHSQQLRTINKLKVVLWTEVFLNGAYFLTEVVKRKSLDLGEVLSRGCDDHELP